MSTAVKILIAVVILAVFFLIGIVPKILNNRQLNSESHEMATAEPEVQVVSPHLVAPQAIVLPGNVQAIRETSTQSRTTGYVSKLYVDIGTHVKAGQVLADIESPDVDQQLAQAGAQTAQSQATVGQSLANVEGLRANVSGSAAEVWHQRANLVQAQAALDGAKSAKAQAEANLRVAKARLVQSDKQEQVQEAALNQAQANYNLADANVKRYSSLLAEGFVAQQDYDTAEASFKTNAAAVASAKSSVEAAQADQKANRETVNAAAQTVLSAQSAIDSAIANVKAARATLESAIESLSASKSNLGAGKQVVNANVQAVQSNLANQRRFGVLRSFEQVIAPFDGIITARNVDEGSLVSPGATSSADATSTTPTAGLFGIAAVDTLRIYVSLPQTDYEWAPPGTKVAVLIREIPNRKFQGIVHQTAGALDSNTRTLLTEVRIPNPKGAFLPGMYAQVVFSPGSERELRIPDSALIVDAEGTKVVLLDAGNHIHYQKVVLGRDYGTEAEVITGLKPSDRVVSNASDDWQEGQTAQVLKPAAKQGAAKS
jgi:RND family efflux transporter MFP subunit